MSEDYQGISTHQDYIMETLVMPSKTDPDKLVDIHECFHRAGEASQSFPIRTDVTPEDAQTTIDVREKNGYTTRRL